MIPAPPRPRPGDEILAAHFGYVADLDQADQVVAGGNGLALVGDTLVVQASRMFWAQLGSSSAGAYAWQEKIPTGGTTWLDGPRSGTTSTDPMYELAGATDAPAGHRVECWRDPAGVMRFRY